MVNKIILAPKDILIKAKKLKKEKNYLEALQLLVANSVEFDFDKEIINVCKSANFEKHSQPNKVKNVKSRWRERVFMGVHYADL